jgi:hypothetical protein
LTLVSPEGLASLAREEEEEEEGGAGSFVWEEEEEGGGESTRSWYIFFIPSFRRVTRKFSVGIAGVKIPATVR